MIPSAFERLGRRRASRLLVAAIAIGATGVSAAPVLAAPTLGITMTHANPYGAQGGKDPFSGSGDTFARGSGGNTYTITVKNNGTEPTSGPVKIVDKLPAGIVALGSTESNNEIAGPFWSTGKCKITNSGELVECSAPQPLAPEGSYEALTLQVSVENDAAPPEATIATLTNKVTVSGGGAGEVSTTEGEGNTEIVPAVPFGFTDFTTSLLNAAGQPETQAGGHPFQYTTELVFNYTPSGLAGAVAGRRLAQPVSGGAKEVYVELPPGFVGNVQGAPKCPLEFLFERHCPLNTVVGFFHGAVGGSEILPGGQIKAFPEHYFGNATNSPVYNMQPTLGHVAALGFIAINRTPFILEAKVRSDGDYGVNVGEKSSGASLPRLVGATVTTCENGAHAISKTAGGEFMCNEAPEAYTRPFLTNPTGCASPEPGKSAAPVTTARANSWDEPQGYAAMESYANAASAKHSEVNEPPTQGTPVASSLLTGCDLLQFNPEIEFKPSPASEGGSSQADEPTGMTVNLKVPQSVEEPKENATPALKNVVMKLPEGVTASPSAADGLQACSNAQFGLGTEFGPGSKHTEPAKPASCPLASQIGTVEVFTPLLSGAPTVEGELGSAHPLTCSQGQWSASSAVSYQWLRNDKPILGASNKDYQPNPTEAKENVGMAVQCQVTATNAGGSAVAVSQEAVPPSSVLYTSGGESTGTEPAQPPLPPSLTPPSGARSTGSTLTCAHGVWTEKPTFSYHWLRGGEVIAGAEEATYTLTAQDEGKVIECQVIGTNAGGIAVADSAAVVVPPEPSSPPLPGGALQGQVFLGQPECEPCTNEDAQDGKMLRLFLQLQDPSAGVIVKVHGVTKADPATGRLETVFEDQPEQSFERLQLKLNGGARASLANPQSCGAATTTTQLTPWSVAGTGGLTGNEQIPGTPIAEPSSSFNVDFNGAGGACPATPPFSPSFNAGTSGPSATTAGASTNFSVTFGRHDREQDLSGFTMHMPLGLVGKVPAVKECDDAEIKAAEDNAGGCRPESEIGTATTLAGPGPDPFATLGHAYFTGPYDGAPFGVVVVTLAKAGPFNLGNVVVRSAITINPNTAAVTITTPTLPQIVSGVPIRLREVNVNVTKSGFMLNPTNCNEQQISGTLGGAAGADAVVSSPFGIAGCKTLPFHPTFTASTQAHTSKTEGASLDVKVTYPPGAYANIAKTVTDLPTALPSRLTTIQKACVDTVFEANPAMCPEGSVIGHATAHTPVLNQPLEGPAYLISHGNRAFPDLEVVLQGEGVTVVLDGQTDIKKGVTKTSFEAIPDAPISTFELNLPEGPHSALAAPADLCSQGTLDLPTILTGQNGAVINQTTHIAIVGCRPTVAVTKAKLNGNGLVLTVKVSAEGAVTISGKGLKTTKKNLKAGTHQIRVALTKNGRSLRSRHKKTSVRVSLKVGKQAVAANATAVRL